MSALPHVFIIQGCEMSMYRLRSLRALLNEYNGEEGFNELENQEIYFAPYDELNDPLEGSVDYLWQGDEVVWKNLLRHYLLCLDNVFQIAILPIPDEEFHRFKKRQNPFITEERLPGNWDQVFNDIKLRFFASKLTQQLLRYLSKKSTPLREDELLLHLQLINSVALESIAFTYRERKFSDTDAILDYLQNESDWSSFYENLREFSDEGKAVDIQVLVTVMSRELERSYLRTWVKEPTDKRFFYLLLDFPREYMSSVKELVFPIWSSACFMSDCMDMSVWGHYGDGHRGVCLIFRTQGDDNHLSLPLQLADKAQPSQRLFKKINYSTERIQVDFFRSLMTLPEPTVMHEWYMTDGKISPCAEALYNLDKGGREDYWAKYSEIQTLKTPEWSVEREYRLVLEGHYFHDISEIAKRKATYDFADLEGIVFGIKTPASAKAKIIRIIHNKCIKNKRSAFKFFQARFDYRKHEMVFDDLMLFRSKE